MQRMRTIDQAFNWLQETDPETALTKTALRRLVISGQLPCVKVGTKYLINLEMLEDYLQGTATSPLKGETQGIRAIQL